jgi:hypothetical protein
MVDLSNIRRSKRQHETKHICGTAHTTSVFVGGLAAVNSLGQGTATLVGTVTVPTGTGVADASITLLQKATGHGAQNIAPRMGTSGLILIPGKNNQNKTDSHGQ